MHTVTKSRKTSTQKNKMLLMKNPQFLSNQADILPSEFIHWTDILTKFHNNWTKIVDFLVIAFYFPGWTFFWIWSHCAERFTLTEVFFRKINYLVISLLKPLLSRNFCQKFVSKFPEFPHCAVCTFL